MYIQLIPSPPDNHPTHRIEITREKDVYKWLTQLPVLYLILREGAGVSAGVVRACGVQDF